MTPAAADDEWQAIGRAAIAAGLSLDEIDEWSSTASNSSDTVGDQLDTWLGTQRIEESTRNGYIAAINFWKSHIGGTHLRSLKHSAVLTAIAKRPDLSGKTINNYVSVLREGLELAVTDRIIAANPTVEVPRASHQKAPAEPFDREETEKIIAAMPPGQVQNLVEFWMWTGMRTSEIATLNWSHVDLASCSVLVTEVMVRGNRKSNTKTNVSRTIRLNSRALAALQRQRGHTFLASGEVFQDPR